MGTMGKRADGMVINVMGPELIIERIKQYDPFADVELIEKAFNLAQIAHSGQKRISGEPYIHPVEVA